MPAYAVLIPMHEAYSNENVAIESSNVLATRDCVAQDFQYNS